MKNIFIVLSLIVMSAQAQEKVQIATGKGNYFKPWHFVNENNELVGYDVDVGMAACELARLDCEFVLQDWPTIIPSIRFDKYDAIMSGMTNNANRRRVIDFSLSYAQGGTFVVTNDATSVGKDFCLDCPEIIDVEKPQQLEQFSEELKKHFDGKTVAVQINTVSHDFFKEQPELLKFIKLKVLPTRPDVFMAVAKNEADIGFGPDNVESYNQENSGKMRVYDFGMSGGNFGRGVGIAVRKTDRELKEKLSAALEQLKASGKMKELAIKWFGQDVSPK